MSTPRATSRKRKRAPTEPVRHIHHFSESHEIQQWNETADRLIPLISKHLNLDPPKLDTADKKRLALGALCTQLCRQQAEAGVSPPKYDRLKAKYENAKQQLNQLSEHSERLAEEIERNRQILDDYMNSIHRREHTEISEKLDHLQELVTSQVQPDPVFPARKSKSAIKKSRSVTKVVPQNSTASFVEFDVKTTEAIAKYRKKSARIRQSRSTPGPLKKPN
jgi:chromosome segregation ATPase